MKRKSDIIDLAARRVQREAAKKTGEKPPETAMYDENVGRFQGKIEIRLPRPSAYFRVDKISAIALARKILDSANGLPDGGDELPPRDPLRII
jgi:hypothetical protein